MARSPAAAPPPRLCEATNSMSGPGVQISGSTVAQKSRAVCRSMNAIVGQKPRRRVARMARLSELLAETANQLPIARSGLP